MKHKKQELLEARQLGIQQAEDEVSVEDAIDENPYSSDSLLSARYWQGYLDTVETRGDLDDILEEVHNLAAEYFDTLDSIERLGFIIPFPYGSILYTAFLESYFYFIEAYQESRLDGINEAGEDWLPPRDLIDALETNWRDRFFEKMNSSADAAPPPRLYKFRKLETEEDISRVVNDILRGNELWFSKVPQLNDLYEFKMMIKNDLPAPGDLGTVNFWDAATYQLNRVWVPEKTSSELLENMKDIIVKSRKLDRGFKIAWKVLIDLVVSRLTQIRDELGVCCLAGNVDNRVLWTHYGGENQGVALGFSPTSSFWSGLRRVNYAKRPPMFSSLLGPLDDIMAKAIITKHNDWSHENEWRLIGQPSHKSDPTSTGQTQSDSRHIYPKSDLVEVVFGAFTTDTNKKAIVEACARAGLTPEFFDVCKTTGYKLEIRKSAI